MTRKGNCRLVVRVLHLCVVLFALVSVASAEWKEKVLYSFQGVSDGATPAGGVAFDQKGNLYGATTDGGSACPSPGCGTVFQLTPPAKKGGAWTETILYGFSGNDGSQPAGSVIVDTKGNLYGTTAYGGSGTCILLGSNIGCGIAYELSPPAQHGGKWTYAVLYNFQGGKDGQYPRGDLVFDSAGSLYGATVYGGGSGTCNAPYFQFCGTVFKLNPPKNKGGKWEEKLMYSFKSGTDGANPNGSLVFDGRGAVYGTTFAGGNQNCKYDASVGCGTAFELKPPSKKGGEWAEKWLHVFSGGNDGGQPSAGLIFDAKGLLYGVAGGGNTSGGGIVFRLAKASGARWKESVLHWFSNDGAGPLAGLLFDGVGDVYGTTIAGAEFCGTVFRLKPRVGQDEKWGLTVLYDFKGAPDGRYPAGSLIFHATGNLYGTTNGGGASGGYGTVFEIKHQRQEGLTVAHGKKF
jgi:uncharacterized repeat protein (TIGR03803 family)